MMHEGLNDATWVVGLLALRGPRLGGAVVANEVADDFVAALANASGPMRTVSATLAADSLTGTLDLAATLALGRPVQSQGLLAPSMRI